MAAAYDRFVFRAGGQAVLWRTPKKKGAKVSTVAKVKVIKLSDGRQVDLGRSGNVDYEYRIKVSTATVQARTSKPSCLDRCDASSRNQGSLRGRGTSCPSWAIWTALCMTTYTRCTWTGRSRSLTKSSTMSPTSWSMVSPYTLKYHHVMGILLGRLVYRFDPICSF